MPFIGESTQSVPRPSEDAIQNPGKSFSSLKQIGIKLIDYFDTQLHDKILLEKDSNTVVQLWDEFKIYLSKKPLSESIPEKKKP